MHTPQSTSRGVIRQTGQAEISLGGGGVSNGGPFFKHRTPQSGKLGFFLVSPKNQQAGARKQRPDPTQRRIPEGQDGCDCPPMLLCKLHTAGRMKAKRQALTPSRRKESPYWPLLQIPTYQICFMSNSDRFPVPAIGNMSPNYSKQPLFIGYLLKKTCCPRHIPSFS